MKIFSPDSFLIRAVFNKFPRKVNQQISYTQAQLVCNAILQDKDSIGLIPTTDLLTHKELFVSSKFGISFDGSLCNSYIYYSERQKTFEKLYVTGDVSSIDVVLSKILFFELYESNIDIAILTEGINASDKHLLIIGDYNYENSRLFKGISFSEEVTEQLEFPFVNYVLASTNEESINEFHKYLDYISEFLEVSDISISDKYSNEIKSYIQENISSVVFKLDSSDAEAVKQLINLCYYYKIIEDIIDVKFV